MKICIISSSAIYYDIHEFAVILAVQFDGAAVCAALNDANKAKVSYHNEVVRPAVKKVLDKIGTLGEFSEDLLKKTDRQQYQVKLQTWRKERIKFLKREAEFKASAVNLETQLWASFFKDLFSSFEPDLKTAMLAEILKDKPEYMLTYNYKIVEVF